MTFAWASQFHVYSYLREPLLNNLRFKLKSRHVTLHTCFTLLVAILGLRSGLALGGFGEFGGVRIVVMEKRTWVGSYSRYFVSM